MQPKNSRTKKQAAEPRKKQTHTHTHLTPGYEIPVLRSADFRCELSDVKKTPKRPYIMQNVILPTMYQHEILHVLSNTTCTQNPFQRWCREYLTFFSCQSQAGSTSAMPSMSFLMYHSQQSAKQKKTCSWKSFQKVGFGTPASRESFSARFIGPPQ